MRSALTFIPFALVAAAVAISVHVYLYRRMTRDTSSVRLLRRAGAALFGLLTLLFVMGPALARFAPGSLLLLFSRASFVWWVLAFYLFLVLVSVDAARFLASRVKRSPPAPDLPPDPARRAFLARATAAGASVASLGVTGIGIGEAYAEPEVTELPVRLPGLPPALSGMTIAHLTDIHAGVWIDRKFMQSLADRTLRLKPDAVVITGDLVDGSVAELASTVAPLASMRPRFGTWFVTGNHEYYSGVDSWCDFLRAHGVKVLRNACLPLGDDAASIDLVGVDDWMARSRGFGSGWDLDAAVRQRRPDLPGILLAHQPRGVERAAELGLSLQLSGHTHGGQVWPWSLAVRVAYPYLAGHYRVGTLDLYVNRGSGFWGPPVRILAAPEILRVVLT